ncbi:nucleotide exchange factor GrpE [Enterobacterales bacterium endosymbiont of Anomoneura mori]|uniref:nucleotide exchange factor GrpE n=1 Tax=Enterobacterales bacterium endosymbiont of Anomoneura mori TaxID=3132096 RepID=UPI00399D1479
MDIKKNISNEKNLKNENIKNINEKTFKKENNDNLNKHINKLELHIEDLKKKEYENYLRYKAKIENFKKRTLIDVEKTYKFILEKFSKDLLLIIDNLEMAVKIFNKNNNKKNKIFEGIELTLKSLISLINKYGIKVINKINIPFDPIKHQAISEIITNKFKSNYVINIMQNGYILHDRLLRPAMVIVSKNSK